MNDFVVVIPSRLGSSRLKEKPLIDIAGKSLIQRVYERVQLCSTDQVYIATDSKKIVDHVNSFTDQVVMTDDDLPREASWRASVSRSPFQSVITPPAPSTTGTSAQ